MSTMLIRLIIFALSFINTIDTYRIRRDIDFVERIQPEAYSSAIDEQCQLPSTYSFILVISVAIVSLMMMMTMMMEVLIYVIRKTR